MPFWRKDRKLGVAEEERKYDLPLGRDNSVNFLVFLVGLMTFLAVLAVASYFALGGMAHRWSSGLENTLTIEIPAEVADKTLRNPVEIKILSDKAEGLLKNDPLVKSAKTLDEEDIQKLVEPWLGKDALIESLPLPGIISVELTESTPEKLDNLKKKIHEIAGDIVIDAHESWLNDLLRLTGALQLTAFTIVFVIGLATVMTIAGGVRSQIAVYRADVELLHLMGASDDYIMRQFQRHTMILGLRGGVAGMLAGIVIMLIVSSLTAGEVGSMLPSLSLKPSQIMALLTTPAIAALIAGATARLTVLHALTQMP